MRRQLEVGRRQEEAGGGKEEVHVIHEIKTNCIYQSTFILFHDKFMDMYITIQTTVKLSLQVHNHTKFM